MASEVDPEEPRYGPIYGNYAERYNAAIKLQGLKRRSKAVELAKKQLKSLTLPRYWQIMTCLLISAGTENWHEAELYLEAVENLWNSAYRYGQEAYKTVPSWLMETRRGIDELQTEQAVQRERDTSEKVEELAETLEDTDLDNKREYEEYDDHDRDLDPYSTIRETWIDPERINAVIADKLKRSNPLDIIKQTLVSSLYHADVPDPTYYEQNARRWSGIALYQEEAARDREAYEPLQDEARLTRMQSIGHEAALKALQERAKVIEVDLRLLCGTQYGWAREKWKCLQDQGRQVQAQIIWNESFLESSRERAELLDAEMKRLEVGK